MAGATLFSPIAPYGTGKRANGSRLRAGRCDARQPDRKEAAKLGRLVPPLGLSGPPFIGGLGGMTEPRGLLGIWPTLAPRTVIEEFIRVSVEEA